MLFKEEFEGSRCVEIRCQGVFVDDEKGKLGLETDFCCVMGISSAKGQ